MSDIHRKKESNKWRKKEGFGDNIIKENQVIFLFLFHEEVIDWAVDRRSRKK